MQSVSPLPPSFIVGSRQGGTPKPLTLRVSFLSYGFHLFQARRILEGLNGLTMGRSVEFVLVSMLTGKTSESSPNTSLCGRSIGSGPGRSDGRGTGRLLERTPNFRLGTCLRPRIDASLPSRP